MPERAQRDSELDVEDTLVETGDSVRGLLLKAISEYERLSASHRELQLELQRLQQSETCGKRRPSHTEDLTGARTTQEWPRSRPLSRPESFRDEVEEVLLTLSGSEPRAAATGNGDEAPEVQKDQDNCSKPSKPRGTVAAHWRTTGTGDLDGGLMTMTKTNGNGYARHSGFLPFRVDQPLEVHDMRSSFEVASRGKDHITAEEVEEMHRYQTFEEDCDPDQDLIASYRNAIVALNNAVEIYNADGEPCAEILSQTYVELLQAEPDDLDRLVGGRVPKKLLSKHTANVERTHKDLLLEIRRLLLHHTAQMQAKTEQPANSEGQALFQRVLARCRRLEEPLWANLDPFMGLVIIINAVVIGLSTDVSPEWLGWTYIQGAFTLLFLVEIMLKVAHEGLLETFFGEGCGWHLLDLFIVAAGIADAVMTLGGDASVLDTIMVVRLCRFARLTRLVRVLRLRIFKELTLLITGCIVGLRTLFWAVILLCFFVYCLGVACRQLFGQSSDVLCKDPSDGTCSDAQIIMERYRMALFGSVPRSMFTLFRCFTDGCVSTDGTVLPILLLENYGAIVTLVYIVCFLFVIFGLFNLIMAIFVENTIANARHDEEKRREARHAEHVRVARKLQEVIVAICTGDDDDKDVFHDGKPRESSLGSRLQQIWWPMSSLLHGDRSSLFPSLTPEQLATKVTPKTFRAVMARQSVQDLLEDLGINVYNASTLFDVLDADGNGTLEVQEMVQGLMKLRSGSEKNDTVAALLAVRCIQKDLKVVETLCLQQEASISKLVSIQQETQETLKSIGVGSAQLRALRSIPENTS